MKKPKKLILTGALSLILLTETVTPAFGSSAPPDTAETYSSSRSAYNIPYIASEADNGLYWIDPGKTYRSGVILYFYATGAGYGPDEPQELDPVDGSTRYIPVNWNVSTKSSSVASGSKKVQGSWPAGSGTYSPGEYRFKGSFLLNTKGTSSVPFSLWVNYQKQTYREKIGWKDDGGMVSKSVSFYIRDVSNTEQKQPEKLIGSYYAHKKIIYRITGSKKAAAVAPKNRSIENADIQDTITVDNFQFKVTAVSGDAFSNCTRLKKVSIGKNVKAIGKKAFYGAKRLTSISLKTAKLTKSKVGSNAFKGIKSTCSFSVPSSKSALYKMQKEKSICAAN